MISRLLFLAALLFCGAPSALAQGFSYIIVLGTDNNGLPEDFEVESAQLTDFYWDNGDYTVAGLGGVNWTAGRESANSFSSADQIGFARGLSNTYTQTNIYFQLTAEQADYYKPLRLVLDWFNLTGGTTHNLEVSLNNNPAFWSESAVNTARTSTIDFVAGLAGARVGSNKLTLRRTGGTLNGGSAFIGLDYVHLLSNNTGEFISTFTVSDPLIRPGEPAVLAWRLYQPFAAVSINQGVGDVTALTTNGVGSVTVNPVGSTTYTLSATFNSVTQTKSVTVTGTPWYAYFEAGLDDNVHADFSHEDAADDNYYFAGDYTSVGGPNQLANEVMNDDTNTDTIAGRTGNPAIGLERSVTEADPVMNMWFVPNPSYVNPQARVRLSVDIHSLGAAGATGPHNLEFYINDNLVKTETGLATTKLVQVEVTGLGAGLVNGPNKVTIRRTGGQVGGWVIFDYYMLEYQPGTPPAISSVTADPILGTRTIQWAGLTGKTYRVQASDDGGATFDDLAVGFPTGGATSASLFYEDRVTPAASPTPTYRVLQE